MAGGEPRGRGEAALHDLERLDAALVALGETVGVEVSFAAPGADVAGDGDKGFPRLADMLVP